MALTSAKLPVLTFRPEFKQCNDAPIHGNEHSSILEAAQRQELIKLARYFRELQQQGNVPLCSLHGPGKSKSRKLQMIMDLNQTNAEFRNQISVASNSTCQKKTAEASSKTDDLLQTYDCHIRSIDQCLHQIHEVSQGVDKTISSLVKLRLKWNRLNEATLPQDHYSQKIEVLENRLQVTTSKFNQICVQSSRIRREISSMLLARKNFFDTQRKYRRSINAAKYAQAKVVQKSYLTYDVIEAAKARVKQIRKYHEKELTQHQAAVEDRRMVTDNYFNIRRFNDKKNEKRPMPPNALSRKERENKKKLKSYDRTLERYKYTFKIIWSSMSVFDENKFLGAYMSVESANLSLEVRNMNINAEIVSLQEQVLHLKKKNLELKTQKKQERQKYAENKKKAKIFLYSNQTLKEQALRERAGVETYMATLKHDVKDLYDVADAEGAAVEQLLGQRNKEGPKSCIISLRAIERRCAQFVKLRDDLQAKKDKFDGKAPAQPFKLRTVRREFHGGPYVPQVVITGHHEVLIEDEDDKSFTYKVYQKAELVKYIQDKISRSHLGDSSSEEGSGGKSNVSSARTSSTFVQ